MSSETLYEYTVVLVFPGFGEEREIAESVTATALDWLNNNKETPGFRFNPVVGATLEVVQTADECRAALATNDRIALLLLVDLADEDRDDLVRLAQEREIGLCTTVDVPRRDRPKDGRRMQVRIRSREDTTPRPPGHSLNLGTFTDPVGDPHDNGHRINDLIAVMALSVMQYHFRLNPTRF